MAPARASTDEGNNEKPPTSPRKASAAANKTPPAPKRPGNNGVATPANRKTSAGQTPKTAPAAAGGPGAGARKSPTKKSVEPSLLGDFLLGRPSPARQAAARRKSVGTAAVRQELRQQMRQDAVRRVQRPGGVQSRVKQWQANNAAAMATGNPEDAASEPTEVAVQVDEESVTEEDRVRIKFREKSRRKSTGTPKTSPPPPEKSFDTTKDDAPKEPTPAAERPKAPPKKRIVSDDNWMKRNKGNMPPKATAGPGARISPSFPKLNKPSITQNRVKDWAMKVEVPASPAPPKIPDNPKPAREYATRCGATITVEEDGSTVKNGRGPELITVEEDGKSSARTWATGSSRSGDDGIRVKAVRTASPHVSGDERLNIKPTRRNKEPVRVDDGIRVQPIKTSPLPDDGIRVRPVPDSEPRRVPRKTSRDKTAHAPGADRERTPTGRDGMNSEDAATDTPTRKSKSRGPTRTMRRATAPAPTATETSITYSDGEGSWTSHESDSRYESDKPSSAPEKSLADIPFGNSAFSELDLPLGADHHHFKRPKLQKNTSSFKAVPNAFKKIMTGAKEIVHEKVDPPKPVVNQPPSIEKWLNGTVDPFVEKPAPKGTSVEKDWEKDVRRRASAEIAQKTAATPTDPTEPSPRVSKEEDKEQPLQSEAQRKPSEPVSQTPIGLKRSKATKINSFKQPSAKTPLRETLNNLFRGESSGHKIPTKAYSSYQDTDTESESSYTDYVEQNDQGDPHVRSVDPPRRSPSPESSYVSTDVSSNTEGPYMTSAIPRHRPPPTNGQYELSTIVSEGSESTVGSETMTVLSESTVTQTTALTRSSAISRRNRGPGLKRRLTKHSDLVSVLSLPDQDGPVRASSIKSTSSLRRRTSNLERVTAEDLLKEFSIDEDLYRRELKTLVDGAIPVLLKRAVHGEGGSAADLFSASSDGRGDSLGRAVVNMGVALEKLKALHKWAPLNDVDRILTWVFTAYPVYDKYLDAWRLGFEGIIVNLAPASGRMDDEDSLINAMPRNAAGDVVDTEGQPVDLQRLLTRPLARVRGLLKLLRGARAIGIKHPELALVIDDFTTLQEKARRRYREEVARKTDEDASNTDTSRCSDLRNLKPMEGVLIDPTRQVNAKDFFSMDICHSNGQRLECQVELIYRDKPKDPTDRGDVLIRDTGHARFSLLFPPIPKSAISARRGDYPGALVLMVRGRHNGKEWYELLTLTTDLEEQVLDWLDMLGTTPVPPQMTHSTMKDGSAASSSPRQESDVPLGERTGPANAAEEPRASSTPSRYHVRHASTPSTPRTPPADASSFEHSPKPFREDGAPPPPVHRTLSTGKPAPLSPPVELAPAARIRRRGSSPLKHEYRPSDVSSDSSESDSDSASDVESSGDELDEADVPDTQPAISIKETSAISGIESVVSDNSITPSHSASQVGLYGRLGPGGAKDPEYTVKAIAAISYWSDKKGQWGDAWHEACSIVVTPGLIEAYPLSMHPVSGTGALNSSGSSEFGGDADLSRMQPLIALELTPIVMIRQSTVIDLEVRSPVRPYCKLAKIDGKIFRFRATSTKEGSTLYTAVHQARLNNAKYKALEEEARFRSFGQPDATAQDPDGQSSSSHRRSWFGRRNSYRASTRAPSQSVSQSQGTSSSSSAPSLFKRLTGSSSPSFNIDKSSVDRRSMSRPTTAAASLYTSGSSSSGNVTPPRSPSVSMTEASSGRTVVLGSDNLKIRCHLLVTPTKWEDHGNCNLQITRPPPGMRQELRIRHGMEKRVIVTKIPKKTFRFGDADPEKTKPIIVLDVVLGSKCFGRLGARGIILNVWEDLRDEENKVGVAPKTGNLAGTVKKWCFQCSSATEANWIYGLVAQEVNIGLQ
ncbi:hypothetical protein M406DRAFT_87468 [Cryphonectria parasitica EP155]|uniref:Uncharacterized protein n=1 Tax=Cryphonectria parasitica (strain ATCC 38755 / EP155) TaxID=660469 RepID=A0A9P4YCN3_CRYP1|nr:uncharacterized protein M406DRAFT_87468 [Cryphonectria parasitica EP155]KAF3770621.1 hypothetical protein M406DRAFT_87468 [Cryphonectria parasitica EP155]